MTWWLWILAILGGATALYLLFCVMVSVLMYRYAVTRKGLNLPQKGDPDDALPWKEYLGAIRSGIEWIDSRPCEEVFITAHDGVRLRGRFLRGENAVRTVLCVHGFRGSGSHDFSVSAQYYLENSCDLLIIDQRAHGQSGGKHITFGIKERVDCRDWARWLDGRMPAGMPLYLDGISMGCSTVLMAAGLDLPERVRGIVADCGFTSPADIFRHVGRDVFHVPIFPTLALIGLYCRLLGHFSVGAASTLDAVANTGRPIVFLHGLDDDFVPCSMTRSNEAACAAPHSMLLVPGAGHFMSRLVDPDGCRRLIFEMFERCEGGVRS